MRDQKTSVFHAAQFCVTTRGAKPYTGRACLSPQRPSIGVHRPCLFPAWITHLPTPQGCGQPFGCVSYPGSKLTPSVCKTQSVSHTPVGPIRGAFFLKNIHENGIAANACPRVLPTPCGRGQPTAPLLNGRQVAGARARERTGGAATGGRGQHAPRGGAPRRGPEAGEWPQRGPLLGPWGPRYGSPDAS